MQTDTHFLVASFGHITVVLCGNSRGGLYVNFLVFDFDIASPRLVGAVLQRANLRLDLLQVRRWRGPNLYFIHWQLYESNNAIFVFYFLFQNIVMWILTPFVPNRAGCCGIWTYWQGRLGSPGRGSRLCWRLHVSG